MTSKHEPRWHFLDIYHVNLHVATTRRELKRLLKIIPSMDDPLAGDVLIAAATSGHNGDTDGEYSYHVAIWINAKMWRGKGAVPAKLANICSHEATHAAGMIWRHIAANMDHDTLRDDEPIAYLIGWLTEWLYDAVMR